MTLKPATGFLENLISQYGENRAPRFYALIKGILQLIDDELYEPLRQMEKQRTLDAVGVWLDHVGERLGVTRPSVTDAGVRFGFGSRTDTVGFDQAPFASVFGSFSSRSAISDVLFRKILRIRAYQIIEGVSRQNLHDAADGYYKNGVAYTAGYSATSWTPITNGVTTGTIANFTAIGSSFRQFSSVGYGGWAGVAAGSAYPTRTAANRAGPTPGNLSPFVYTDLTGMTSTFTAQGRGQWVFSSAGFSGWAGTRRLRVRHCLRRAQDSTYQVLKIQTRVQGSSTWVVAATVKAQQTVRAANDTDIQAGATITDTDGTSFTCSALGGWIDAVVSIAANVDQIGFTVEYSGSQSDRIPVCIAQIAREVQGAANPNIVQDRDDPDGVWELLPFSVSPAGIAIMDS